MACRSAVVIRQKYYISLRVAVKSLKYPAISYRPKFYIMILKQRFADGRTAYTDIGDQWLYIQPASDDFKDQVKEYFKSPDLEKDCIGLIQYGYQKTEPIYKVFPQWIYSNDGRLFIMLV